MTVKELIDALLRLDPDLIVAGYSDADECDFEIKHVEVTEVVEEFCGNKLADANGICYYTQADSAFCESEVGTKVVVLSSPRWNDKEGL